MQKAFELIVRAAAIDAVLIDAVAAGAIQLGDDEAQHADAQASIVVEADQQVRAVFEAKLRAYRRVMNLTRCDEAVTEPWIRRLHAELCASQESISLPTESGSEEYPLNRGDYKAIPNCIQDEDGSWRSFVPVKRARAEVHRLVGELASTAFSNAHPAVQAAYSWHSMASCHPFLDGNGRVARALASVYLYPAAGVPFFVFCDRRHEAGLAAAAGRAGDYSRVVRFALGQAVAAMDAFGEAIRAVQAPSLDAALEGLVSRRAATGTADDLGLTASTEAP
jgi:hypothetical protein